MPTLDSRLKRHVHTLCEIGPRGLFAQERLHAATHYICQELNDMGYTVGLEPVECPDGLSHNVIAEFPGSETPNNVWLAGAHYDTVATTPGADDNASAVAILLEMAREFAERQGKETLRFVFFTNEEMPYFSTKSQGAMVHAAGCQEQGEKIQLMASLEMLGYYSNEPGSQKYPIGVGKGLPDTGNFVAFVGTKKNTERLNSLVSVFKANTHVPTQMLATPIWTPSLIRSDHFAFVLHKMPAVLITDTADFRNPNYHSENDTPNTLNYTIMAGVTLGLVEAFAGMAQADQAHG
jgi:Zn-dependent M28 family amino/carboxypeptidase